MDVSVSSGFYEEAKFKTQVKRHPRNRLFLAPGNTYPLCDLFKSQVIVPLTLIPN
jgi:hypothetical protein